MFGEFSNKITDRLRNWERKREQTIVGLHTNFPEMPSPKLKKVQLCFASSLLPLPQPSSSVSEHRCSLALCPGQTANTGGSLCLFHPASRPRPDVESPSQHHSTTDADLFELLPEGRGTYSKTAKTTGRVINYANGLFDRQNTNLHLRNDCERSAITRVKRGLVA